ncbi:MAG: hypothetical protein M3010_06205, partial [Candidatus Dormibacteraeota bacterium]|nr:hypothetical protein [Candidatus Dormibacteraeota bacterium]
MTEATTGPTPARANSRRLTMHPPPGSVPDTMLAQVIRPGRYGEPRNAFAIEEVPTPAPGPGQALVHVMA